MDSSIGSAHSVLDRSPAGIAARVDSLRPGGRSFRFDGLLEVLEARDPAAVVGVLRGAEAAARAGHHAVGFLAYEAAPAFDAAMRTHPPAGPLPLAWFAIFSDRLPVEAPEEVDGPALGGWTTSLSAAGYRGRVERVREWIAAGDSYQVNLTFALRAGFAGGEEALYARLCQAQRGAYNALIRTPEWSIVSVSPELFFRWRAPALELRPMKGTAARGRWTAEDDEHARRLRASPKERSENLMIVDLLRNDAGRVAEYGSVEVDALFEVERYPTVLQMTSTIRARTREGVGLVELFGALFPSGSVTGAPKIRSMEIIAELEHEARGVYTGAVGFVSPGEVVFNVPIRTLVAVRGEGGMRMGVGSGVTHDSEAGAEHRECLQKAAFTAAVPRRFELLETMRFRPDEGVYLLDEHLDRLVDSARYFSIPLRRDEAEGAIRAACGDRSGPLRLRLLLARDGALRVESAPLPAAPAEVRTRVCADPIDTAEVLLYHKTTWREPYRLRREANPDLDDVILTNERGELTEFTIGNLVIESQGQRWTPPLHCGVLPGTLRAALLRDGRLAERVLRMDDLLAADRVHRINSVQGWAAARVQP